MGMTAFELFGVLKLDKSDFDRGLKDAAGDASSFGSKLGGGLAKAAGVGLKAIGAATAAATAFAGSAVAAGSSFDAAMGGVAATAGKTVDELNATIGEVDTAYGHFSGTLRDFAMYMGQNTTFSATQAAEALNYMALAGYNTQQSMEMLPSVLSMAAAGGMELAKASDMITDTQSALGLDFDRTSKMVNEFAKAASTGNTSVEQLGEAMLRVGGLGAELNGGFVTLSDGTQAEVDNVQELEIAFTAMANAGIKGAEAGTHMRNMLLKLASPTDDGAAAFEALGVSIFDDEGKMRSLGGIMEDLSVGLNSLTQEEKLQAISDIFNTRDTAAAEALMNAIGEDWSRIGESILQADGAADEMSKTKLDNLTGDLQLFNSALETAQITINDQLSPYLRDFVQLGTKGISEMVTAFNEGGLSGAMASFGEVLSEGLSMIIGMLPKFIDAGIQLLGALGQGLLANMPMIIDAAVQIASQIVTGLISALPAVVDGALQIIEGLAGGIAQMLPTLIPLAVQIITQIVNTLINNVPMILQAAIQLVQGLADGIISAIPVLVSMIPQLITSIVNALIQGIPMLVNGAIQLFQGLVQALPDIITTVVDMIPQVIDALVNGLLEAAPLLIDANIQLVLALVQALPQIIQALVNAVPTIIQTVTTALLANLPQLIDGLVQMNIMIVSALPQIMTALIQVVPQIFTMIVNALFTSVPMLIEAVISILSTVGETLLGYGATLLESVGEVMSSMIDTVVEWLSQLPTQLAYWAGYAIGQFIAFFIELPAKLMELFNQVIDNVRTFGENLKNKAIEIGKGFFNGLIDNIKALPSRLKVLGSELVSALKDLPKKFIDIGTNIIRGLWEGIKNAWGWLTESVSGLFGSLVSGLKAGLGIASPSKVFAEIGKNVDLGYAKGITDNFGLVDEAMTRFNDVSVNPPMFTAVSAKDDDIIRLLERIAENREERIVLEGGLDRLFRVMQSESRRNKQITGQESFA